MTAPVPPSGYITDPELARRWEDDVQDLQDSLIDPTADEEPTCTS